MKAKILGLITLSIFALIFTIGFGSAVVQFTDVVGETVSVEQGQSTIVKFKLQEMNDGVLDNSTFNFVKPVVLTYGSNTFNSASTISNELVSLSQGDTSTEMSLTINVPEYQTPGLYQGNIEFTAEYVGGTLVNISQLITLTVTEKPRPQEVQDCIAIGDSENLMELEIEEITVTGFGEEDDEWVPLDEIEVEVRVENTEKDFKLEDVEISWGLYNLDTQEWVFDEEESDFNIKDDEEETQYLTFTLEDPDDFEDGGNYVFYVWANAIGEELENNVCRAVSEDIDVIVDSDFLILDNFEIEGISLDDNMYPDKVSCGDTLQLTADIWNIGDSDQEDIEVRIYNADFGIDEILEIGDVDKFDSESISFEFTIPEGMDEDWNTLELTIQEDGDVFENDYVDEDAEFEILLDLENCILPQALVSASLDEGGKAGKELIVRATIKNTGKEATNYLINAYGYAEWASSADVEPSTLTLQPDQATDVLITLDVDKSASGEKLFNIEVVSEGELVISQPLSVSIEKSLIGELFGDNALVVALVVGIAVILVIIIIVLAVRVARR